MLDRQNNFVAVDNNDFLIMGEEHTKKDEEVSLDIVICLQKDSDKHTSMLITFFYVGCSEKEKTRYRENSLKQQNIAPVELLIRDHKKPDENGKLKTCPVANGSAFSRSDACEILIVIIDGIITNKTMQIYVTSSEQMMRTILRIKDMVLHKG